MSEKLWCPSCGKWGDHGSAQCPEMWRGEAAPDSRALSARLDPVPGFVRLYVMVDGRAIACGTKTDAPQFGVLITKLVERGVSNIAIIDCRNNKLSNEHHEH